MGTGVGIGPAVAVLGHGADGHDGVVGSWTGLRIPLLVFIAHGRDDHDSPAPVPVEQDPVGLRGSDADIVVGIGDDAADVGAMPMMSSGEGSPWW